MEIITKSSRETQKFAEKIAEDILSCHSERKRGISKRFFGLCPQNDRNDGKGKAIIIALEGDLGGGKTTFVQGFAKGLGVKEKILSPTFVLIKRFTLRPALRPDGHRDFGEQARPDGHRDFGEQAQGDKINNKNFSDFYHIDCYRINNPRDLLDLEFEKIINNSKNIVIIEWAERIEKILPEEKISIKFKWLGENKREIIISNF